MKRLLLCLALVGMTACSENYSNGERIGLVTQFSRTGAFWKSWEGHLNLTQTGMNSASTVPFDFSIDNDKEDPHVIALLDSAAQFGWKVKLVYHETLGRNWFLNRGGTNHFITTVDVLDRTPMVTAFGGRSSIADSAALTDEELTALAKRARNIGGALSSNDPMTAAIFTYLVNHR